MHFSMFQGLVWHLFLLEMRNAFALYFVIDSDVQINDERGHLPLTYDLAAPIATLTRNKQRWGENLGLVQVPQAMHGFWSTGPRPPFPGA